MKLNLDLNVHFVVGLVVAIASAIAGGTVHLTNAIPADWIPVVTAWSSIIGTCGGLYLAMLSQAGGAPPAGPPAASPKIPAIVLLIAGAALLGLLLPGTAHAQGRQAAPRAAPPGLTGDPIRDVGNAIKGGQQGGDAEKSSPLDELAAKIRKLSLADFKYAAALAHATGNTVTAPCWDEWVKLLTAQQQPLNGADGQPLKEPDPHLATDIERLSEMVAQLQPRSELSVACAPMATTAQKDAATLIGAVLSGGAMGLFKLPFAIP